MGQRIRTAIVAIPIALFLIKMGGLLFALGVLLLGLVGFRNLVAYMYPIEGYFGLVVIFMITVNFFKVLLGGKKTGKKGVHEQYD